jgi:hypothetical protein
MSQYIDNIEDCTLGVFRKVISKHDYKHLLIDGKYDEEEAKKTWLKLFDEYSDSIKSGSVNYNFEMQKQIAQKQCDYNNIQNYIYFIGIINEINLSNELFNLVTEKELFEKLKIDELIRLLNEYNFRFNVKKGIVKELDRVKRQSKNILNRIESDIKKLESKNDSKSTFIESLNDLIATNEQLKKQDNG